MRYPGYSYTDQVFSELMDEAAPTRTFIVALNGIPYPVLLTAFGVGIWTVAVPKRAGRIIAALFGRLRGPLTTIDVCDRLWLVGR
jgi:hypothetical protein